MISYTVLDRNRVCSNPLQRDTLEASIVSVSPKNELNLLNAMSRGIVNLMCKLCVLKKNTSGVLAAY